MKIEDGGTYSVSGSIIPGCEYTAKTGAILVPRLVNDDKGTVLYTNSISGDLHEVSAQKFLDLLMNEQTTDTREEVALPPNCFIESDWEDEDCPPNEALDLVTWRGIARARIRQLRASILACKKAGAANEEKDAELNKLRDKYDSALSEWAEDLKTANGAMGTPRDFRNRNNWQNVRAETAEAELASIRASVGDCVAMKMVLAIYRMQHKYDLHCEGDEICAACEQADKLLPAPPTKDKE